MADNQKHYQFAVLFVILKVIILQAQDARHWQLTYGVYLKRHEFSELESTPFETKAAATEMECIMECESIDICKSLNAIYIDGILECELLEESSRDALLVRNVNSTVYEYINGDQWQDPSMEDNYCQPECENGPYSNDIRRCLCNIGSLVPIQSSNGGTVSLGAANDSFGQITVGVPSGKYQIKLVHKSGGIKCNKSDQIAFFGCAENPDEIQVKITNQSGYEILPGNEGWYEPEEHNALSPYIIFQKNIVLTEGQVLLVWYNDDLINAETERDNTGKVEYYVLAWRKE